MRRRHFVLLLAHGSIGCLGCLAGAPSPDSAPSRPRTEPRDAVVDNPLTAHAEALRSQYARHGFTVVVSDPFVVVGDQDAVSVERHCTSTVAWATKRLKEAYFTADPPGPITIWLFRDAKSYRSWAWRLFEHRPDTPYGYYSADVESLVMDISTGGGTLVHEMVHPFIDTNFPACPSWLDEGLASLYEACAERDGKIVGVLNWRLSGLQESIATGSVPRFETLMHTTRDAFYDEDPGTNYAQARYLCYYLQERGLMRAYYKAFVSNAEEDPSGYATLKHVAEIKDIEVFERDWREFVRGLRLG